MTTTHQYPLERVFAIRIVIIEEAIGTAVRTRDLKETCFHKERSKDRAKDLLNEGDLCSATKSAWFANLDGFVQGELTNAAAGRCGDTPECIVATAKVPEGKAPQKLGQIEVET